MDKLSKTSERVSACSRKETVIADRPIISTRKYLENYLLVHVEYMLMSFKSSQLIFDKCQQTIPSNKINTNKYYVYYYEGPRLQNCEILQNLCIKILIICLIITKRVAHFSLNLIV